MFEQCYFNALKRHLKQWEIMIVQTGTQLQRRKWKTSWRGEMPILRTAIRLLNADDRRIPLHSP